MTLEIRELVIQAKVVSPEDSAPTVAPQLSLALEQFQEERLIRAVTRRVIEQLRDEGWGAR
ncbi:hypothetical protein R69927_02083 [Paraburkholderia domus]|jgi:hypothetical protein|uniref:Uncharacterized protein n=1 Tax=Paraburkholderia domus TaxID=2793075 RepID=A0A9N8MVS6_9BURK|nr:DUF5908 family protein [Paraburkholderia domus]MBK5049941.1 hypothetical protein [Burkholderia sp. R-70006]MBK5062977.1 hypothetical protein [Burkholderia sp. R-70199]MBK5086677.1 hypothetical protein [Burkholderia sp. R-69927]MBK5121399.1 hypothetical protein [Burkholderia sp. R-69980]MBK5166542.1 hypothetical protein [Burkholderia sp. R-70211]MBK5182417.1 hypothetical protein [Burkholderia sp. R-69749]MCI0147316.1 hypothetical protein [Paraburkholderia sediminicola]